MLESLFPETHRLLKNRRFQDLEDTLARAQAESWSQEFDRHNYLTDLASCGIPHYVYFEEWLAAMPDSRYAHSVLAYHWSQCAAAFRGSDTSVSEMRYKAAMIAADLSARWAIAGLEQSADKVFVATELYSLERYLHMPTWFYGAPQKEEPRWEAAILRDLSKLGYSKAPPIPKVPWGHSASPDSWLLDLAWSVRPDAYYPAEIEINFLRPRWHGSLNKMRTALQSERFKRLTHGQREVLQVCIDTDNIYGCIPYNVGLDIHNRILHQFDTVLSRISTSRARAVCLTSKAEYLEQQEDTSAAACIREAMDADPTLLGSFGRFSAFTETLFLDDPSDRYCHSAAVGALQTGNLPGMAALYMIQKNGIGVPKNPEFATQIVKRAAEIAPDNDSWSSFCTHHPEIDEDWVLDALEAGAQAGLIDCNGQLARIYYNRMTPKDDIRAKNYAERGLRRKEPMAQYVKLQVDFREASTSIEKTEVIKDLADLGKTYEGAALTALKLAYQHNMNPDWQMMLVNQALDHGYDWAESHVAFHLYYGLGVKKDRKTALHYAGMALEYDNEDPLALAVLRANRFWFLNWRRSPNKAKLMERGHI